MVDNFTPGSGWPLTTETLNMLLDYLSQRVFHFSSTKRFRSQVTLEFPVTGECLQDMPSATLQVKQPPAASQQPPSLLAPSMCPLCTTLIDYNQPLPLQ